MSTNPNHPEPNKTVSPEMWETVNDFIAKMESFPIDVNEDTMLMHVDDNPNSNKREQFDALVNASWQPGTAKADSTLLAQWAQQSFEHNWMNALQKAWQSALQTMNVPQHLEMPQQTWQHITEPFQNLMEELSQGLVPAPAVRNAHAVQEKIYAPKRRGIEASNLPVFNPLFCTALDRDAGATVLHGLDTNTQYRLTLRGIAQPDWLHETTITSTDQGSCEIDFAGILHNYEESNPEHTQTAWVLRKLNADYASGWTSGVVWLEDRQRVSGFDAKGSEGASWQNHTHQEFRALIEINLLLARGKYIQAYDQARTALLFARRNELAPDSLYIASLWQFCRQSVSEMIRLLQAGTPVFHQIVPGWNAVASLEELHTLITPRA